MKSLLVSALAAVMIHIALFLVHPVREKPELVLPENRAVRVSLAAMPEPVPPAAPLPQIEAARVAPLAAVAMKEPPPPKPPPKPAPKPVPDPEPAPRPTPPEPAVEPVAPPPEPDPPPADPVAAEDRSATRPEAMVRPEVSEVETAGPADDAEASDRVQVQGTDPTYDANPLPEYPLQARRRNYEGTVLLKVFVDVSGRAARIELVRSSGYAILDNWAEKSVSKWRFQPATRNGSAVESWVEVPVRFELK